MKTASEARNGRPSLKITQGVERAAKRSMVRGVGFGDGDFDKPIVGVANAYSTITPCNMGLNDLAVRAGEALREMGAMPQVFGTITVSDGISMGTEGMRYSLVSREVIADSIETACAAQRMDGLLAIGGCDKNMPGAMIAIARLDIPAVLLYRGPVTPGHCRGPGAGWIDERGPASARHRTGRRGVPLAPRFRSGARPGPGAVRPQAVRAVRHDRSASRRRHSAGHAHSARPQRAARRRRHYRRKDGRTGPE